MRINIIAYIIICLISFNEIVAAKHNKDTAWEENSRLQNLRKLGNNLFNGGHYREAFNIYKKVTQDRSADLNDIRNCTDACGRLVCELAEGPERYAWFNEWARWASQAANHQDSNAQDIRNAAGIYYSLHQYETAAELRERAAAKEPTWEDFKKTALTYNSAQNYEKAQEWFQKLMNHPDAPSHQEEIEDIKKDLSLN